MGWQVPSAAYVRAGLAKPACGQPAVRFVAKLAEHRPGPAPGLAAEPKHAMKQAFHKRPHVLLAGVGTFALTLAWWNRFVQDDAFISFSYARSLVEGHGLTWFGSHVEGYTNFLWVLWIAAGLRCGVDPIVWSHVGGLLSFAATIYAMSRLSELIFKTPWPGLVGVLILATNYTTSSYATGGLETMSQAALLSLSVWQLYEIRQCHTPGAVKVTVLSLLLAAALLTRLDSALPAAIVGVTAIGYLVRRRARPMGYVLLVMPVAAIVGAWLLWKLSYYGQLLPNTFDAKVGWSSESAVDGLVYVWRFLSRYLVWPFLLVGGATMLLRRDVPRFPLRPLVVVVVLWLAYVAVVGGDFMEFRFIVPIAPLLFLILAYLVLYPIGTCLLGRAAACGRVSLVLLVSASVYHAMTFRGSTGDKMLDSIPALGTFYNVYSRGNWHWLGAALETQLGGSDVVLASHAVGAIPYYSRLKTIDLYGLNDRETARHGNRIDRLWRKPGHRVHATLPYLRQQKVNLIIMHPRHVPRGIVRDAEGAGYCRGVIERLQPAFKERIREATLVEIPIDESYALLAWYLTPHPRVEQLLQAGRWQQTVVERGG